MDGGVREGNGWRCEGGEWMEEQGRGMDGGVREGNGWRCEGGEWMEV